MLIEFPFLFHISPTNLVQFNDQCTAPTSDDNSCLSSVSTARWRESLSSSEWTLLSFMFTSTPYKRAESENIMCMSDRIKTHGRWPDVC